MNSPDNLNPKLIDKIINVTYGDASIIEKVVVHWKALVDDNVKNLLEEYRSTANSVRSIKLDELPEHIVDAVRAEKETEGRTDNFFVKIYFAFFSRPILSATAVSLIVLSITAVLIFKKPEVIHSYTEAEIELAQKQLGESLAIVNRVFRDAGKKIDSEVIPKYVSKPLNKGLNLINDYLIGG